MESTAPPAQVPPDSPQDALRPTRCPDCGYSLTGLPTAGRCPECGFGYDPQQIVLYGWGVGTRGNIANSRHFTPVALAMLGMLVLILWRSLERWFAGWVVAVLVLLLSSSVLLLRRHLLRDNDKPTQVRLFPEGCGQRDGFGPVSLRSWGPDLRISLYPRGQTMYVLAVRGLAGGEEVPMMPVQFEFECDGALAALLRARIAEWCGPAATIASRGR